MPTNLTPATQIVLASVAHKVREILQAKFLRWQDVAVERSALARCLRGRNNMHLAALIAIANALDHDVVIHFRARTPPEVPYVH